VTLRRSFYFLFLIAVAFGIYASVSILRTYQGYTGEVFVDIRRGADTLEISGQLERAGVLRSEWPFLVLRAVRPRAVLQAGEYRFDRPLSPFEVYQKIARGDTFYYTLAVPEGYTMFEIADALARTGIVSRQQFLLEARKGERVADLAPGAASLEGLLFPDTYRVNHHTTAEQLAGQMVRRFREVFAELRAAAPAPPGNVLQTVVLASLVEKETPAPAERPLVASVFRNRLRLGMPLQCDPTVIYALELSGRYSGQIHKEDLASPSPYNTYIHPGLPPGPIANPGRASLQAALAPADTDYLYFVSDNQGGHVFSSSLERHSKAVASYVRANRRSQKSGVRNQKKGSR